MKKLVVLLVVFIALFFPVAIQAEDIMDITRAAGYEVLEMNRPKASIAIDGKTGEILWQDNIDALRDPASISKVMTLYLVYEAIAEGRLTEETIITATEADQAIAQIYAISNNKIVAGVDYTVGELITMTIVPSSNATTVMLANYLSNNDADAFLDMMNAKAQELGMTNTMWNNASGAAAVAFNGYYLPQRYDNYLPNETTARDLAILVYHLVKKHPAILEHTKDPVVTVKKGTPYEETFETYNYSLPGAKYGIEGVNGLKTGSSPRGAFNYIATVNRNGQEVISVIMGVGDWADQDGEYYRHPFGNAIIEKVYADYENRLLLKAGEHEINGQKYALKEDFYGTLRKGTEPVYQVDEQGNLSLDNGLESVSPNITSSQMVTVVENPVTKAIKTAIPRSSENQTSLTDLLFKKGLIVIPLIVILLGISIFEWKRKRK
ncbi:MULTISPECIES: D-alanyl-D-alanine carboxypeptidase [Streptococcus]|uniref:DUF1958 domain-containing protein n=1 Tax=Streptococcus caledonicus TaxID=2614158 RepID=A0ABW0UDW9_9STRE|nr:DUF1958 domain-containing protein [Streptococcus sp. S784/96/1]